MKTDLTCQLCCKQCSNIHTYTYIRLKRAKQWVAKLRWEFLFNIIILLILTSDIWKICRPAKLKCVCVCWEKTSSLVFYFKFCCLFVSLLHFACKHFALSVCVCVWLRASTCMASWPSSCFCMRMRAAFFASFCHNARCNANKHTHTHTHEIHTLATHSVFKYILLLLSRYSFANTKKDWSTMKVGIFFDSPPTNFVWALGPKCCTGRPLIGVHWHTGRVVTRTFRPGGRLCCSIKSDFVHRCLNDVVVVVLVFLFLLLPRLVEYFQPGHGRPEAHRHRRWEEAATIHGQAHLAGGRGQLPRQRVEGECTSFSSSRTQTHTYSLSTLLCGPLLSVVAHQFLFSLSRERAERGPLAARAKHTAAATTPVNSVWVIVCQRTTLECVSVLRPC